MPLATSRSVTCAPARPIRHLLEFANSVTIRPPAGRSKGAGAWPRSRSVKRLLEAAQLGLGQDEAEGGPSVRRSDSALEPRARAGLVALDEQPVPGPVRQGRDVDAIGVGRSQQL